MPLTLYTEGVDDHLSHVHKDLDSEFKLSWHSESFYFQPINTF